MSRKTIDLRAQFEAAMAGANKIQCGDRVRVVKAHGLECGGATGTVVHMPGQRKGVPPHLFVVNMDDGIVRGLDPSLLEKLQGPEGKPIEEKKNSSGGSALDILKE